MLFTNRFCFISKLIHDNDDDFSTRNWADCNNVHHILRVNKVTEDNVQHYNLSILDRIAEGNELEATSPVYTMCVYRNAAENFLVPFVLLENKYFFIQCHNKRIRVGKPSWWSGIRKPRVLSNDCKLLMKFDLITNSWTCNIWIDSIRNKNCFLLCFYTELP